jgi:hypothetical protein
LIINPGTGPVSGTREEADKNMAAFAKDTDSDSFEFAWQEKCGRFTYRMYRKGIEGEVQMPGLPLEQVRFMSLPGQDIWKFPRLYLNGSSWVWMYAVGVWADSVLFGEE